MPDPFKKSLPNIITIVRLGLCWPMVIALKDQNFFLLITWAVIFLLLDNADGILARKFETASTFGEFLDSAVDKITSVTILVAAFYFQIIPAFLFLIIILISFIQLFFTFWAVFFLERKKLPVTYLPVIGGGLLFLSLFLAGDLLALIYCLLIVIYGNHLYYYVKGIFPEEISRFKRLITERIIKLKEATRKLPFFGAIFSYLFSKLHKRNETGAPVARFLTVGNLVTIFRLLLIPVIIYCYWTQLNLFWIALLVIFIGADFLDGALARRFNQVSRFGKIMDAFVDKTLFLAFLLVWLKQELLPVWLLYFLVVRMLLVLAMAGEIWFTVKKPLPVSYFSLVSIISLLFFVFQQSGFWLVLTVLLNWQLIVNYWHQGIEVLLNKRVVV